MSYNERRLKQAEAILFLANQGFEHSVHLIGEALTACTRNEAKKLIAELIEAIEAIESIEQDIEYYKARCEEENKI